MTKEVLKSYYKNLREIKRLQAKTERLREQREKIIDDMNNDNIFLEANIRAVSLDSVQTSPKGFCISQQERAIDTVYKRLYDK